MDQSGTVPNGPDIPVLDNLKDLIVRTRRDYRLLNPGSGSWPCPLCDVLSERFQFCRAHIKSVHPNIHSAFLSSNASSQPTAPIANDVPNVPVSVDISSRVSCVSCGFLAKNARGLSIHMNKHKRENSSVNVVVVPNIPQAGSAQVERIKEFEMLMYRCKFEVPLVRIIQKSIRNIVCQELTNVVKDVVTKNDITSWFRLLGFPYIILNTNKSEKAGQNAIRCNLQNFCKMTTTDDVIVGLTLAINSSNFAPKRSKLNDTSDDYIAKVAMRKINEGDLSGAVNVLCSRETLAASSNETFTKLQAKHPNDTSLDDFIIDDPPSLEFKHTNVEQVKTAIGSFNSSSSGGIDGLRPRHLKDLISFSSGEAGNGLLLHISKFIDFIREAKIDPEIPFAFYGATLTALTKKNEDVRPIAVGLVWRRLASKIACYNIKKELSEELSPIQVGFGVKGGAEAVVHAIRHFVELPHVEPMAIVKIDFDNAFNRMFRRFLLIEIKATVPEIFPMMKQAYTSQPHLYYNREIILSKAGIQQGDPLAPPTFCVGIKGMTHSLISRLNSWFLDDGTIGDNLANLRKDISSIINFCTISGMKLNSSKCEIFFVNASPEEEILMYADLSLLLPGIRKVNRENFEVLGAPIFEEGIPRMLSSKLETVKHMCSRLKLLDVHPAMCILRHCIAAPKFQYLLRTSPTFRVPHLLREIDEHFRSTLEGVTNTKLNERSWTQASLPVSFGGIGLRKLAEVSYPAFFSSIHQSQELSNKILAKFNADIISNEISDTIISFPTSYIPLTSEQRKVQKNWDFPRTKQIFEDLLFTSTPKDYARILASSNTETSKWLQVIPSSSLGLLLDNNASRIAVALRLGCEICEEHRCICGELVTSDGHHGLSCKQSASSRLSRHNEINKLVSKALISGGFPNILEPKGLCRIDGKKPDGLSLIPWSHGKALLWDVTVVDTLAPSYLHSSSRTSGSVADQAERHKHNLYAPLKSNHNFTPIAFETLGCMGADTKCFMQTLGKNMADNTGDKRSLNYLLQRISIAIQRGSAACIFSTFGDLVNRGLLM